MNSSLTLTILLVLVAVVVLTIAAVRSKKNKLPPDSTQARADDAKALPTSGKRLSQPPAPAGKTEGPSAALDNSSDGGAEAAAASARTETPEAPERVASSGGPPDPAPQARERPERAAAPPAARRSSREPTADEVAALKKGLASTRGGFIARLAKVFQGRKEIDPELLDEVEEILITADIGVHTSKKILDRLRERLDRRELQDADKVWEAIRGEAATILGDQVGGFELNNELTVIIVVGVNGVGKTTTIGKLASRLKSEGRKVVLAAGDTFRAAAVLQLEVWGRRVGCPVVKGRDNSDPGAVVFDAIKRAQEEGADVVLADTAGRLHTKTPLMDELKKLGRTVEKALERPADHVLLVLDSTNGQNAIQQAKMFSEALPVDGIALTKLDGTAKGGVILGIVDEHHLPVHYIGMGERLEDLREFEPRAFLSALFEKPPEDTAAA